MSNTLFLLNLDSLMCSCLYFIMENKVVKFSVTISFKFIKIPLKYLYDDNPQEQSQWRLKQPIKSNNSMYGWNGSTWYDNEVGYNKVMDTLSHAIVTKHMSTHFVSKLYINITIQELMPSNTFTADEKKLR